jgi:hypothetical protein
MNIFILVAKGIMEFVTRIRHMAGHSGCAVYGMHCLRSLEHWDRGFESHLKHGCLRLFCVCVGSSLTTD